MIIPINESTLPAFKASHSSFALTRNRQPHKKNIQQLQARVDFLEELLKSHDIDVPSTSATYDSSARKSGADGTTIPHKQQFSALEPDPDLGLLDNKQPADFDGPVEIDEALDLDAWQTYDAERSGNHNLYPLNSESLEALQGNEVMPVYPYGNILLNSSEALVFNDAQKCKSVMSSTASTEIS